MDAEMKKHNERVMQAMEVQAELMLETQQAIADAAEETMKVLSAAAEGVMKVLGASSEGTIDNLKLLVPVLDQMLLNMKFQSWCASEVTKIQNVGATLEVQKAYDQMLLDSGQIYPPGDGFEVEGATGGRVEVEKPNILEDPEWKFGGVKALGGSLDEEPIDEVLQELSSTKEEVSMDGETVPKDLKALLDAQPKEE